jgi:NAD(P)-dependent dehydrogenase (short-subunit alcohol dehydrogenase family)
LTPTQGRIVVVTGAGAGLGRTLAVGLARHGWVVEGLGRRREALDETRALAGERFSAQLVDVADPAAVQAAVDAIAARHGRIDVLINNAAVYPKLAFLEQDAAAWMQVMAINVGGVANGCRAVLPLMMRQGTGCIINVGSFADKAPIAGSSAYAASKGAVRALTKAIAADLGGAYPGIAIYEWIPGSLNTQMSDFTGMDPALCVPWAIRLIELPPAGRPRIFEEGEEHLPPRGLRERLLAKLRFWR